MAFTPQTFAAADKLDEQFPGFSADFMLAALIRQKVDKHRPRDIFERAVVQQCRLAWRLYCAVLTLLSEGFGVGAAIVTRSLFEYVVGLKYLLSKKGDAGVLSDFRDYGLKTVYESTAVPPEREPMYRTASKRFKKNEKWHRHSFADLAKEVGLGDLLRALYKQTSSIAHGDAMTSMLETGAAWQKAAQPSDAHFGEISLEATYMLMSFLYSDVVTILGIDCKQESVAMAQANRRRLKAFAASAGPAASGSVH